MVPIFISGMISGLGMVVLNTLSQNSDWYRNAQIRKLLWQTIWSGKQVIFIVMSPFFFFLFDKYCDVTFLKAIQEWKMYVLIDFFNFISSIKVNQDAKDYIDWGPSKSRSFKVKSFYKELYAGDVQYFSWKGIWRIKSPTKVSFLFRQQHWRKLWL